MPELVVGLLVALLTWLGRPGPEEARVYRVVLVVVVTCVVGLWVLRSW